MINNQSTTDLQSITNSFNNFFVNIGRNLSKKIPHSDTDPSKYLAINHITGSLYLQPTNATEVDKIIRELRNSSPGYDDISSKLLKYTYQIYISPLWFIY